MVFGGLALVVADILAPPVALGETWLLRLLEPDSYFTNQSINGFLSRLVLESDRTIPIARHAFDPATVGVIATILFGLVTFLVLLGDRKALGTRRGLALGIAMALVAASIGAPKNSFWNQALALPAIGLLIAAEAPDLKFGRFGRLDRALLVGWWVGSCVQLVLWIQPLPKDGLTAPLTTLAGSTALYGMVALWGLLVRRLRACGLGGPHSVSRAGRSGSSCRRGR